MIQAQHLDPTSAGDSANSRISAAEITGTVTSMQGKDGQIVWQHTLNNSMVSGLVGDHKILCIATHSIPQYLQASRSHIYALNAQDGQVIWQYTSPDLIGRYHLALFDHIVMMASSEDDGAIRAIDTTSGNLVWMHGNAGSLRDRLLFTRLGAVFVKENDPPNPPHFSVLEAHSGIFRWHYHSSLDEIVITDQGKCVFIATFFTNDTYTWHMIDTLDGKVLATLTLPTNLRILKITDDGVVYAIRALPYEPHDVFAIDFRSGRQIWHYHDTSAVRPYRNLSEEQTVLTDGLICFVQLIHGDWNAEIQAISANSGNHIWSWKSPAGLSTAINSMRLVCDHQTLYLSTSTGIFAIRSQDGTLLWHGLPTANLTALAPIVLP